MKRINVFIFAMSIALLTQSCATIFSGTKSKVKVKGTPEGASVYYNGNLEGNAPCNVKVSKKSLKNGNTNIKITHQGYENAEVTLSRKMKVGAFVGDIFIFPVGHIVDFVTGAIYKPYPGSVDYQLIPKANKAMENKFKNGDKVIFTYDKYENTQGEIIAVYPNRALIKFKAKNNAVKQKISGEEYTEMKVEVPFMNISKQ